MIQRVQRLLVIPVLVLALFAAGCGDSDSADSARVAQITDFANQQLAARLDDNQSADPFTCEEDDDDEWECETEVTTTDADGNEDTAELKVKVTCEAANCTYVPEH
jgi:hypothetical protein